MKKDKPPIVEKVPIVILHVSEQPYLSIGRHYGGIKCWGYEFYYHPVQDAFVRVDYLKQMKKIKDWQKFLDFVATVKQ